MLHTLLILLVVALILALIYYVAGMFIQGRPLQIIGAILALIWIIYALSALNLIPGGL
jgi:hypothetical protein